MDMSISSAGGGGSCQTFSLAGNRRWFEDAQHDLLSYRRRRPLPAPKGVFLKIMLGLLSHNQGDSIRMIPRSLNTVGSLPDLQILNNKDFGVPQSRNRLYLIARREDCGKNRPASDDSDKHPRVQCLKQACLNEGIRLFVFDYPKGNPTCTSILRSILKPEVDEEYFIPERLAQSILRD